MRELNKVLHNESASRSPKPGISRFKKQQHHNLKIHGKNLGDAFDSVSEDLSLVGLKESINASSVSEISELGDTGNDDLSFQSLSPMRDPELSASSSLHSELTQSSEIISTEKVEPCLVSKTSCAFNRVGDSKTRSLEAEIVINFLKKAVIQVFDSSDAVDSQSNKLLHTLVEMVIVMLQTEPEENDQIAKLLAAKTQIVCKFFLLCVFTTTIVCLFFCSGRRSSYGKPPPT